jgi:hypothetical protein
MVLKDLAAQASVPADMSDDKLNVVR